MQERKRLRCRRTRFLPVMHPASAYASPLSACPVRLNIIVAPLSQPLLQHTWRPLTASGPFSTCRLGALRFSCSPARTHVIVE